MDFLRRAWVEIDLNALKNNYKAIEKAAGTKVIPVVKADAYGHGVAPIVKALQDNGADMFAVSNALEAIELREAGIKGDILVLGYTPADAVALLVEHNITQCVYSLDYAIALSRNATSISKNVNVHLKLDTGMGRIGFDCRKDDSDISGIVSALRLEGLNYTGVFAHFSVADSNCEDDVLFTNSQYARFCNTLKKLKSEGFDFEFKHCCNSAGLVKYSDMALDGVRAGIILYGLSPSCDVKANDVTPVMSMYSVVSMVKDISKGDTVNYGRTYKAQEKRRIATISAGYADGIPRLLSNKGYVLIKGKKAPIVGRICMDQFCIDVTDIDGVEVGDIVEIFGRNISVDIVADTAQTINYEIVCGISKRIPRIVVEN